MLSQQDGEQSAAFSLLFPVFIFCIRLVHLSQIVQFLWWFTLNQALSSFFLDNLIRLSGSNEPCSGRVEIYYSGVWGTVCDDLWDLNDAAVACRQLGCGPALYALPLAQFGQGTGPIWLDNLGCSGSETSLAVCGHNGFGIHDCGHHEDAGVICSMSLPKPNITIQPIGVVMWGQDVQITCSISGGEVEGSSIFTKTPGPFTQTVNSSSNSATLYIPKVTFTDEGDYQCQFKVRISSIDFSTNFSSDVPLYIKGEIANLREEGLYKCQFQRRVSDKYFNTSFSDSVQLTVIFPKPSITIEPTGVVTSGQVLQIYCLITGGEGGESMIFTKTSGPHNGFVTSGSNQAVLHIHNINLADERSYHCQVQRGASSSVFSDFVHLNLTVSLPKPSITMDPAGIVTFGDLIAITCSVLTQYLGGSFTLQKTTGSFTKTQQSSTNSSTFRFLEANNNHEGNYYCYYQKDLYHQTLTSPNSDSVTVSVSDN
ncbi:immunoglobulin superfamily member 1-like isoform X1 [Gambusia affinis]|uniref:immunoglobulin superfamily member 1-like isoform X1 n=1 Tax=Gambusia affinis TaxID=33528 RepID=UPI001CDC60DD|nr:immunoglobulin superfamily member 1-like isoform X1 [Gambusia affinis]